MGYYFLDTQYIMNLYILLYICQIEENKIKDYGINERKIISIHYLKYSIPSVIPCS